MLRFGPIPLTAAGGFVFAVAALDDVGAAAVVAQPGDEAIHNPGCGREVGGGFAVQSGHGVIVSISDDLPACQAAVFCFHGIGREPAVHPSSARASEDTLQEYKCPPPEVRRWAVMGRLARDFKPPGETPRGRRCLSYSPTPAWGRLLLSSSDQLIS